MKLSQLKPNPENPRTISEEQMEKLKKSIESLPKMMPLRPIIYDENNVVIGGNMRLRALEALGMNEIPDDWTKQAVDFTEEEKKEFVIKDNVGFGNWDIDELGNNYELEELREWGLDEINFDKVKEITPYDKSKMMQGILQKSFLIPPFSTFNARAGYWQERKKEWKNFIGKTDGSREGLISGYDDLSTRTGMKSFSVSIFDPVLMEVLIRWFVPEMETKPQIIDCFAGDSIKGIVSSVIGCKLHGIELRKEQFDLNQEKIKELEIDAEYICDDGQNVLKHFKEESMDLLFSCPPYFDLEHYSELENDASNQDDYPTFLEVIKKAFTDSIKTLKENRFATIVVGDIRNKKTGGYYGFPDDVKRIFNEAGMSTWNEIILLDPLASAPVRAGRIFKSTLKCVKVHQNILVFYKGDPSKIKELFKPEFDATIEIDDFTEKDE